MQIDVVRSKHVYGHDRIQPVMHSVIVVCNILGKVLWTILFPAPCSTCNPARKIELNPRSKWSIDDSHPLKHRVVSTPEGRIKYRSDKHLGCGCVYGVVACDPWLIVVVLKCVWKTNECGVSRTAGSDVPAIYGAELTGIPHSINPGHAVDPRCSSRVEQFEVHFIIPVGQPGSERYDPVHFPCYAAVNGGVEVERVL